MVGKALSNPFSVFIKKIGFSVGLEFTLSRVRDFARVYASVDTLTFSRLSRLLHAARPEGWGLDQRNNHVLDVLKALDVVAVSHGDVSVLETGDSLGMLIRLNTAEFDAASRFIFAEALLRADGDVFLNALAAEFDAERFSQQMSRAIAHKWDVLEGAFTTPQYRSAIYQAVNIEAQPSNPGGRGRAFGRPERRDTFAPTRGLTLNGAKRPEPEISDSYLRKALPRRKAWAVSLGLADDRGFLTAEGMRFLSTLSDGGLSGPGCMVFWPLEHELTDPLFMSASFDGKVQLSNFWHYALLVRKALGYPYRVAVPNHATHLHATAELTTFVGAFKDLNRAKSMVRVEMPARVAYRCALALHLGTLDILPYPNILAEEQVRPTSSLNIRSSRFSEFAISL